VARETKKYEIRAGLYWWIIFWLCTQVSEPWELLIFTYGLFCCCYFCTRFGFSYTWYLLRLLRLPVFTGCLVCLCSVSASFAIKRFVCTAFSVTRVPLVNKSSIKQLHMYYRSGTGRCCCMGAEQMLHVQSPGGNTFPREMTSWLPSETVVSNRKSYSVNWCTFALGTILPNFIPIWFEIMEPWAFYSASA